MHYRELRDPKGEGFAYLEGDRLFTMDGELTGRLVGDQIVDTAGTPVWRVIGDGVYTLDLSESIGYFSAPTPDDF
jgi:hypothetical protein